MEDKDNEEILTNANKMSCSEEMEQLYTAFLKNILKIRIFKEAEEFLKERESRQMVLLKAYNLKDRPYLLCYEDYMAKKGTVNN